MARHKIEVRRFKADDYYYSVAWSEEDHAFIGRVAEFPSLAAHARTLDGALREIKKVVGLVLEDLTGPTSRSLIRSASELTAEN